MAKWEDVYGKRPELLTLDGLIFGDLFLTHGSPCRDRLRAFYDDPTKRLPEFFASYEDWIAKTNGGGQRFGPSEPLKRPQDAQQPQRDFKPLDEWIAERDADPPTTFPIEPMCKKIMASGWNYAGFRESPEFVRAFVENPEMWPLSEAEMSTGQRRLWRAIVDKFRRWLRGY